MSPVTARMHALLARELIAACGGLDEAAGACRLQKSRLSECQNSAQGEGDPPQAYLPVDVLADLEAYSGKPLYSQALAQARPSAAEKGLVDETCDVAEDASALQRLVRELAATGQPMTPRQKAVVDAAVLKLEQELREVRDAAGGGERPA